MKVAILTFCLAICGAHSVAAADGREPALSAVFEISEPEHVGAWQSRQLATAGERLQQELACRIELKLQKPPVHCFVLDARQWSKIEAVQRVSRSQLDVLCSRFAKNISTEDGVPVFDLDSAVSLGCKKALEERRADLEYATRN